MCGAETAYVTSDFDILELRPIQTSVVGTVETVYKPISQWIRTIWIFSI